VGFRPGAFQQLLARNEAFEIRLSDQIRSISRSIAEVRKSRSRPQDDISPVKQVVDGRQTLSSEKPFGHLLILGELEFVLIENLKLA
jgi:hypothetical protein